ncbi:reverse transcriptase domain-containing protein [Rhizobium sp. 2MFCol3.1]|uniref:reverse transcriptase domain-containing protein n=1 Tax=Rhizobium sp. 2MFCol3.1 TaxID=1246459 RepID=UPI0003717C34|nr:reverse transcriptase domain-containing protein [Rhizobium sp. 2MFCol3.1]
MNTLIREVRSEQNIFSAWRHVKRSALSSQNDEIRGAASEFEHAHQRHLRRIIDQLRQDRFSFDPVTGVLKDARKRIALGKDPRPIAIATLKNRVVQRAILQILQPRVAIDPQSQDTRYEMRRDERLGRINDVNRSRFGVGGLIYPYGGVEPAVKLIRNAIDSGGKYYYQSDIKAFFTKIPTRQVVDFVRLETKDDQLADLFAMGLAINLSNGDELKKYADLFPKNGIGVAQGSSLSAFSGNVLLYEMDHELNRMGVTATRYIDDILIVAKNEAELDAAIDYAERTLRSFGFGLYAPDKGSDKAARGESSNAINFLGCTIQPKRCVPSAGSIARLKETITTSLSDSKSAIRATLKSGKPLNSKNSRTSTLDSIGKRIYGWQKAFSFCTNDQPFKQLDEFVSKQILDYEASIARMLNAGDQGTRMKALGIPSTHAMFVAGQRTGRSKQDASK